MVTNLADVVDHIVQFNCNVLSSLISTAFRDDLYIKILGDDIS